MPSALQKLHPPQTNQVCNVHGQLNLSTILLPKLKNWNAVQHVVNYNHSLLTLIFEFEFIAYNSVGGTAEAGADVVVPLAPAGAEQPEKKKSWCY